MANAITYYQFFRIEKLIEKKNEKVVRMFNAYWMTMIIAFFGPGMFFISLKPE